MTDDRPVNLYHYTNLSAFQSIVENSSLWFSNIADLNDIEEKKFGNQIFSSYVQQRVQQWANDISADLEHQFELEDLTANISILKDWLFDLHMPDLYSTSFSYRVDDLMMWRSYASPPTGICIGFKGDILRDVIESLAKSRDFNWVMGKIRYPTELQLLKGSFFTPSTKSFLNRLRVELISEIKRLTDNFERKFETLPWCHLRNEMDLHSIMYKHPAFKMEQEFRFAISNCKNADLRYRQCGSAYKSYCEFEIPNLGKLIDRVVIGPTPEPERTLRSVRHFMEAKGVDLNKCKIESSTIPYRAW